MSENKQHEAYSLPGLRIMLVIYEVNYCNVLLCGNVVLLSSHIWEIHVHKVIELSVNRRLLSSGTVYYLNHYM